MVNYNRIMTELARAFVRLDRGQKAVLSGYPDGTASEWHVQTSVRIGAADDNRRVTILQRTAEPDQWMTVALTETDGDSVVESIGVAAGEPPADGDDEAATAVDPAAIEIRDVGNASYADRE
jgi:hypothetical protein